MNRRRELNLNSYFDQSVFFNRSIHTFTAAQDVNICATSANQGRTVPLASRAATLWYPGSSKSTLCQELIETNCSLSGWWLSKHFHLNEEAAVVGWRVGKLQAVSHTNPGHQLVMAWVSVFDRKCSSEHWGGLHLETLVQIKDFIPRCLHAAKLIDSCWLREVKMCEWCTCVSAE